MQLAEQQLIAHGGDAATLMQQAAQGVVQAILQFFPVPGLCIAYVGKGNNGGDAIAVLGILQQYGWQIGIRSCYHYTAWSPLAQQHYRAHHSNITIYQEAPVPLCNKPMLLLDGLLGIGSQGPLRADIASIAEEINYLRDRCGAVRTIALDVPSGVDPETGEVSPGAVEADFTMSLGAVKQGLLMDDATTHVGRLVCITLPNLTVTPISGVDIIHSGRLSKFLSARSFSLYKNQCGHVGVIAGNIGMLGAAKLCCTAALKAGAGLVTLFVHDTIYSIAAAIMPAEIMVTPVITYAEIPIAKFSAFLIGPGLGSVTVEDAEALQIILETGIPTVLDADGLNLAAEMHWTLDEHVLATPHHGEMRRLVPEITQFDTRTDIVDCFLSQHAATLIYKGARSIVTQRGKPLFYNISGNPGMATAGQGDVLAGVCAGLIAQGESLLIAALLGTYLCGRAAEIAITNLSATQQTLTAGDTLKHLSNAIHSTAHLCY